MPILRALGGAGIEVFGVGDPGEAMRFSRFCHGYVALNRTDRFQERMLAWLREECPYGAVVIPCADDGLELVARHRRELEEQGLRPMEANDEITLIMLDKARTYALAAEIGVRAPQTIPLRAPDDVERAAVEFSYPFALKAVHSHLYARHFPGKALMVNDRAELARHLTDTAAAGVEMIATEIVPGADDCVVAYFSYLDEDGDVLLQFTSHKIRQYPTGFGLASYAVNGWEPDVADAGLRFLRAAGVRGISETEFKRDPRDGQLTLLECNNRFTVQVRAVPVDVPRFVYNRMLGRPAPPPLGRRAVHLWNPLSDVITMAQLHRRGELTLREWVRSLHFPLALHVFRLDDPLPTVAVNGRLVYRGVRRVVRELRARLRRSGGTEAATVPEPAE